MTSRISVEGWARTALGPPNGGWNMIAVATLIQNNSGPSIGLAERSMAG
jgi:hypothetical protein